MYGKIFIKNLIEFWCSNTYSQILSRKTKFSVLFATILHLCEFESSLLIAIIRISLHRLVIKDDMRTAGIQYSFSFQRNNSIKTTEISSWILNKLKTKNHFVYILNVIVHNNVSTKSFVFFFFFLKEGEGEVKLRAILCT